MAIAGDMISNLERSRHIILDMMETRGFNVASYRQFSTSEIRTMYQYQQLDIELTSSDDTKAIIKYLMYQKPSAKTLKNSLDEFIETYKHTDKDKKPTIIFIIPEKENDSIQKMVQDLCNDSTYNCFVQVFWIKQLIVNVTLHHTVPKHEIISDEEYQTEVKEAYNISSRNQLPRIDNRSDPIAKFIGMKQGQVCRITRRSETNGEYVVYRHCR